MKRIGILGGISHESTIRYYELILEKYYGRKRDYYYPEVVIFSLDFQKYTDLELSGREKMLGYVMEGIRALEAAGAEFIMLPLCSFCGNSC